MMGRCGAYSVRAVIYKLGDTVRQLGAAVCKLEGECVSVKGAEVRCVAGGDALISRCCLKGDCRACQDTAQFLAVLVWENFQPTLRTLTLVRSLRKLVYSNPYVEFYNPSIFLHGAPFRRRVLDATKSRVMLSHPL
jgi:hypothetical protein